MARTPNVYLHNDLAGHLVQDASEEMVFEYVESWLSKAGAIPLSQLPPLKKGRFRRKECRGLFAGVLPEPDYRYRKLSAPELAMILKELPKRPLLAGDEGIRLSLAGEQDKIAVRIAGGEVRLPLGGAPSTHILKPAVERFDGIVFNEALCMKLAAAVETRSVEGMDYLLVERCDRIHRQLAEEAGLGKPLVRGRVAELFER